MSSNESLCVLEHVQDPTIDLLRAIAMKKLEHTGYRRCH